MRIQKELTPIQKADGEVMFSIMKLLADNGNQLTASEIHDELPKHYTFTEALLQPRKTWSVNWWSIMHMIGIEYKYAGYLYYAKNLWTLTEKGQNAVKTSNSAAVRRDVLDMWRAKSSSHKSEDTKDTNIQINTDTIDVPDESVDVIDNEDIKLQADTGIRDYIKAMGPYKFQDFVAALFRAMGYNPRYIAKKGADRGIDMVLSQDPLGVNSPRVNVQVKHYPNDKVSAHVIQCLVGTLHHSKDAGIVITSGAFTTQAKFEARDSHCAIRIIDGDELIALWKQYYNRMPEEDKKYLPIEPIYFLKHEE